MFKVFDVMLQEWGKVVDINHIRVTFDSGTMGQQWQDLCY